MMPEQEDLLVQARESLAKAKQIIEQTGYHRRDQEVKELEARFAP